MKYQLSFLLLVIGLLTACNSKPNTDTKSQGTEVVDDPSADGGDKPSCYRYFGNRDTIYLQLSSVYGTMTGMLLYKIYEKDQNLGTLMGNMVGDVLLADYTFKSEGVTSVRQVAFKRKGNDWIEGYGDVKEVNGKMVFSDLKTLAFDENRIFANVPCK